LSIEEFAGMAGISQSTIHLGKDDSARQLSLETKIKIMQAIRNQEGETLSKLSFDFLSMSLILNIF